jgi:xanthine dehydrogenase accessory factor
MKEFYKERLEILKNGESFVLASIFDSQGSAPRTAGARMIIKKDSKTYGTVGGGKVEALVIVDSREIFNTKKRYLRSTSFRRRKTRASGWPAAEM